MAAIDSAWIDKHYEFKADSENPDRPPVLRCRRCGVEVGYLTKHAAVRHGDDVEVLPVKNSAFAELY